MIRKVDNSGKRFFLYSWYLTFANKNMVINADYIPNQIAPESEVQLGRVRGLTFNENEAINPYRDLESYIYHITANDPVSEKALQMVIRMYHTGKELLKVQFYQIIGQVIFYLLIVLGQIMTIMRMIITIYKQSWNANLMSYLVR